MVKWTGVEVLALRRVYGIGQEQFAHLANVSPRSVGYWEQNGADAVLSARSAGHMQAMLNRLDEHRRVEFYRSLSLRTALGHSQKLSNCAAESVAFAEWVAATDSGQLQVESLTTQLSSIARRFIHAPPGPLLLDLQELRNRVESHLRAGPALRRTRELVFLGGVAVELLAQITDNVGDSISALQHAMAAEVLACKAGHDGLQAWAIGTKALIAEWHNDAAAAWMWTGEAAESAPPGEPRVRLAALQARSAARLGRIHDARDAIHAAVKAADSTGTADELVLFGGSLRFPTTKLAYYIGSSYGLIQDYPQAERWALEAITGYESGAADERSYGDEAIARTDVAVARIARGAIDGAAEILRPVFKLQPEQRIYPICDALTQVDTMMRTNHCAGSAPAKALSQDIEIFTATKLPTLR
ncbi:helix-turn-helix domain-containing protein [Nocardia niigatensis]